MTTTSLFRSMPVMKAASETAAATLPQPPPSVTAYSAARGGGGGVARVGWLCGWGGEQLGENSHRPQSQHNLPGQSRAGGWSSEAACSVCRTAPLLPQA